MNDEIEILRHEVGKLSDMNHKLQDKLNIAIEGLKALISDGIQSGIAQDTLEEIKKLDLPQEDINQDLK